MTYRVRIYCHTSLARGTCDRHEPPHPFIAPDDFGSILAANDYGEALVEESDDDEIEWEVIDEAGEVVS